MTQNIPYHMSDKTISVFLDGKPYNFDNSFPQFAELRDALKGEHDLDEIRGLVTIPAYIEGKTYGKVTVGEREVYYKGKPVHNHLTERLLAMITEGFDITPWANFMDRLMGNPNTSSRDQLYFFLEKSNLPLTPDGFFLAYKKVNDNYTDCRTGKFDNSVGKVPSMPREDCDSDRGRVCSSGLHFCSQGYLNSYGGARTVILKIDPADVVSIPSDHNDAKGRACRYEVVGELGGGVTKETVEEKPVSKDFPSKVKKSKKKAEPKKDVQTGEEPIFDNGYSGAYTATQVLGALAECDTQAQAALRLGLAPSTFKGWVKKAKAWKEEQVKTTYFGAGFTVQQVLDAKTKHGTTAQAAKALGVAKSTYRGWLKKARALA